MKVALVEIEKTVFNTAYMQIAQYTRAHGDEVVWWDPRVNPILEATFDNIYCSSLFDFTDKKYVPKRAICGGTGFDIKSRLPESIESSDLDYSIYPDCDRSYVWFSRGCERNCKFCVVRQKEGAIRPVDVKNLNPNGRYIVVQDNNFFANPKWRQAINWLQTAGQPVDFQGIDARTLNEEQCRAINSLNHKLQIKIAWDNPPDDLEPKLKEIFQWIRPYRLMCYVLIGFNSTFAQDMHRVQTLRKLGVTPFVMKYKTNDPYQKAFARWTNRFQLRNVPWEEYKYKSA